MKGYVKTIILLFCLAALTGCSSAKPDVKSYVKEQDEIMDKMMDDMHSVENTGNASLDFLYGMIPHHESAVEMAESYLKYGNDKSEFKKLAEDIISAQNDEIRQMQDMIKELEAAGKTDAEQEAMYLQDYQSMMMRHHTGHSVSDTDLDTAFAQGMMMHHQMALDMAEAILRYTDEENIAQFAEGIISLQQQEIAEMQDFLSTQDSSAHH